MPTPSPGDGLALSGLGPPNVTAATLEGATASLSGAPTSLGAPGAPGTSTPGANVGRPALGSREADGGWALSWCKEKYWGQILVATADTSGLAMVGPRRRLHVIFTHIPRLFISRPVNVLNKS